MLVSYSQQDGFLQGARDTFSGERPCDLCSKIAEAKNAGHESREPVAPVTNPAAGKLVQDMLPSGNPFLSHPAGTELPRISFAGISPPPGHQKASPPVPPPCASA